MCPRNERTKGQEEQGTTVVYPKNPRSNGRGGTRDDSCMPQKNKTPGRGGTKDDCRIPRKSMDEGPRRTMHNNSKTLLRKARKTSRESTSQEGRGATAVYTRNERTKGQDGAMDDNCIPQKCKEQWRGGKERQLYAPNKAKSPDRRSEE